MTSLGKMLDRKQATGLHPTPYLRNINVRWGSFDLSDVATMDISPEQLDRVLARDGDLIVCEGGEPGRAAVWRGPEPIALQKALHRVRPSRGVSPDYLAYWLWYLAESGGLAELFTGSTIKHLPQEKLRLVRVPLPPSQEQERIVAAIEEQFSRLDAAEASLGDCRARLSGLRRAALNAAFPRHWPAKPLVEVSDPDRPICYGILKPRSDNGEIPYVEVRSIRDGVIDVSSLHRTTPALHEEFRRSELRTGDVVLAIRGSWDRAAVVPRSLEGANVSRDVARIAPLDSLLSPFLAYFLESPRAQAYYARHARGVGVRGVNIGDLRRLDVPIPDLDEQRATVEALELQLSLIGALATALDHGRARSDHLRRAIVNEAFCGRLVPQDASDEPASELLARIAAERSAATPRPRKSV